MNVFHPIQFSTVYPDLSSDFETFKNLLRSLNRSETLITCARLNLVVGSSREGLSEQGWLLKKFFTPDQISRINKHLHENPSSPTTLFFRGQFLELMRWVCLYGHDHPTNSATPNNLWEIFAQVALIAGDMWHDRVYKSMYSPSGEIIVTRENSLGAIRRGVSEGSPPIDLLRAFGRGKSLICEYLPRFYPDFESNFTRNTQLTIKEYYACLFAIASLSIQPFNPESPLAETVFDTSIATPSIANAFSKFIEHKSQTVEELRQAIWGNTTEIENLNTIPEFNLRPLRNRPILRFSEGRAIALDPVLLSEQATVGPLFELLRGQNNQQGRHIFSYFGKAFESYAADILRRIYPSTAGLIERLKAPVNAQVGRETVEIADACVRDVSSLILFEMKAKWIRDEQLLGEVYINALREQYRSENNQQIQLVTAIKRLVDGTWESVGFTDDRTLSTLYPILVSHDILLGTWPHPLVFMDDFAQELEPDEIYPNRSMRKGRFIIRPYAVMTIDILEDLEESLNNFSLSDFMNDYWDECSLQNCSLHDYMRFSPKYSSLIVRRGNVLQKALQLLDEAFETITGHPPKRTQLS